LPRSVGEKTHRVEILHGRPCRHHDLPARQSPGPDEAARARGVEGSDDNSCSIASTSCSGSSSRPTPPHRMRPPERGTEEPPIRQATYAFHVRLGQCVGPHVGVHRGSDQHRATGARHGGVIMSSARP
jgi:hypothetical protein